MSRAIVFRPLAWAEYVDAIAWYSTRHVDLGSAFEQAVEAVIADITARPKRFPVARKDIREAPVGVYPYCVYYRVLPNQIVFTAVYHQSRDPIGWQSRN